jgi:hypothetical protein
MRSTTCANVQKLGFAGCTPADAVGLHPIVTLEKQLQLY